MKKYVVVNVALASLLWVNPILAQSRKVPSPTNVGEGKSLLIGEPGVDLSDRRIDAKSSVTLKEGYPHTGATKTFDGATEDNGVGRGKPVPEPLAGGSKTYDPSNVGTGKPFIAREQGVELSDRRPKGTATGVRKERGIAPGNQKDFLGRDSETKVGIGKGVGSERAAAALKDAEDSTSLSDLKTLRLDITNTKQYNATNLLGLIKLKTDFEKLGKYDFQITSKLSDFTGEKGERYTEIYLTSESPHRSITLIFPEWSVKTLGDLKKALAPSNSLSVDSAMR